MSQYTWAKLRKSYKTAKPIRLSRTEGKDNVRPIKQQASKTARSVNETNEIYTHLNILR